MSISAGIQERVRHPRCLCRQTCQAPVGQFLAAQPLEVRDQAAAVRYLPGLQSPSERGHGSILRVSLAEDEKVRPDLVRDHGVPDRRGVAVQVADASE